MLSDGWLPTLEVRCSMAQAIEGAKRLNLIKLYAKLGVLSRSWLGPFESTGRLPSIWKFIRWKWKQKEYISRTCASAWTLDSMSQNSKLKLDKKNRDVRWGCDVGIWTGHAKLMINNWPNLTYVGACVKSFNNISLGNIKHARVYWRNFNDSDAVSPTTTAQQI